MLPAFFSYQAGAEDVLGVGAVLLSMVEAACSLVSLGGGQYARAALVSAQQLSAYEL